jgi:hypothetical protein
MSKARDIANILTASTNIATDAEVTTAMSAHNTAANGHIGRGTTGNRPASPSVGDVYFDTTLAALIAYKSTGWEKVSQDPAPSIASITPTTAATTGTTITITGSSFKSGLSVQFIGTNGTAYNSPASTFVNGGSATATTPSLLVAYEPYDVKLINSDNQFAVLDNCLDVGGSPTWSTSSGTLATISEQTSLSTSVSATDPDGTSIVYSSSNLPAWVTLNSSTGALTGTAPEVASDTTYSFDVSASDGVNTSSRAFNVIVNNIISFSADFLVVAGGGGSGWRTDLTYYVGGGGGGGLRSSVSPTGGGGSAESSFTFNTGTTYTIAVGAGGVKASVADAAGTSGENSSISGTGITTVTSIGGGRGGRSGNANSPETAQGGSGGSGGGAGGDGGSSAGTGTQYQGYNGGSTQTSGGGGWAGAGGGGAGGVGGSAFASGTGVGGAGGEGVSNNITGSSVTYAGGGRGGQGYYGSSPAAGNNPTNYTNAANYGMGGAASIGTSPDASNGGSGVVILRSTRQAASTTGSPTYTTSGSNHIYKFTGNGSITY